MAMIVIFILVLVVAVAGLIAWLPTDDEDHQPLVLRDGSRVVLPGGRRRLASRRGLSDGGGAGGVSGGDGGCGGDGGGSCG